jgi:hypothetical protein
MNTAENCLEAALVWRMNFCLTCTMLVEMTVSVFQLSHTFVTHTVWNPALSKFSFCDLCSVMIDNKNRCLYI